MDNEWEFYSMRERWGDITGVRMFLYTHVIYLRNKTELWDARVAGRYASRAALPDRDDCVFQEVDRANIWPSLLPPDAGSLLVCPADPDPEKQPGIHVKRVRVADYDGSPTLGQYVLHEARIAQRLRACPHPNIARFRGCLLSTSANEITGLCFDRYAETLTERIRRRGVIDVAATMAQLRAAVAHLHALGIVHNDVAPENVMFVDRASSHVVLVDFDSCAARGGGLPKKRGPTAPGATSSEFENDQVGLELVHRTLLRYDHDVRYRA